VANEPDAGAHVLNTPNIQVVFSGAVQWDCTMGVLSAVKLKVLPKPVYNELSAQCQITCLIEEYDRDNHSTP
jgi:hypothetical protein